MKLRRDLFVSVIAIGVVCIAFYALLLFQEWNEVDPIRTMGGVRRLMTFDCFNGAGGNSWCDENDPNHIAP